MTRLRLFLKNLARPGLSLFFLCLILSGCNFSTKPTYLKEDVTKAIQDICKKEYKLDVAATLTGQTLWVYLPVEDIMVKPDKPKKSTKYFSIDKNSCGFIGSSIDLTYSIRPIAPKTEYQQLEFNKKTSEKARSVLGVLMRVLPSTHQLKKGNIEFACIVIADTKNKFMLIEIFYYKDLRRITFGLLSLDELQRRTVISVEEGLDMEYRDITLPEFITEQIRSRVQLEFETGEARKNIDIDKVIEKIAVHTIRAYEFKDFNELSLYDDLSKKTVILNKAAVWQDSKP